MNRIELKLKIDPRGGTCLKVFNDIKGLLCYQIGETIYEGFAFENSPFDMFMLLTSVDYSKLENYMSYGIRVEALGKKEDEIYKDTFYKKFFKYCRSKKIKIEFVEREND